LLVELAYMLYQLLPVAEQVPLLALQQELPLAVQVLELPLEHLQQYEPY